MARNQFVVNTDVITKIKNTLHTAGINSSMYRVQILDTARRWNPKTHAKTRLLTSPSVI